MRMRHSTRALALVALLALIGLGTTLYDEAFVHTDDGCAVEVHCIACRLLLGGATVLPTVPILAAAIVALEAPIAPEPLARRTVAPRLQQPRAPPLA
jgi:hypothetical protein